jgi:hypothetical protein
MRLSLTLGITIAYHRGSAKKVGWRPFEVRSDLLGMRWPGHPPPGPTGGANYMVACVLAWVLFLGGTRLGPPPRIEET